MVAAAAAPFTRDVYINYVVYAADRPDRGKVNSLARPLRALQLPAAMYMRTGIVPRPKAVLYAVNLLKFNWTAAAKQSTRVYKWKHSVLAIDYLYTAGPACPRTPQCWWKKTNMHLLFNRYGLLAKS